MRLIFFVFFCLLTEIGSAQFGLRIKSEINNYEDWNQVTRNATGSPGIDLFNSSYEIGIDYWFRLKNIRIEFYPEISYGISTSKYSQNLNSELPQSYKLEKGGVGLNTHIYFLDLKNDCQCPTFSKQNGILKKGLFLLIGVKELVQNKESLYSNRSVFDRDFTTQFFSGLGIDFGISDLLTLSPFVSVAYSPSTSWDGININHGIINIVPPDETTSNIAYQIGLRIGFRPDYLNQR